MQGFIILAFLGAYYALITHSGLITHNIRKDVLSSACRFIGALHTLQYRFAYIVLHQPKERIDTMARQKNIKFQMKQELQKMEAYGRSKHADQIKTKEVKH